MWLLMSNNIGVAYPHVNCYFASWMIIVEGTENADDHGRTIGSPVNSWPAIHRSGVGARGMTGRARFDFPSFYAALSATVKARDTTWKAVSELTGVSQTTLSRMSNGRQPDAASLTALSAWSGLDPVDFISTPRRPPEPIAMVSKLLREDPNLDRAGADALETIITAAYDRFRRQDNDR